MLIGSQYKENVQNEISTWAFSYNNIDYSKVIANEIAYNKHYVDYYINIQSTHTLVKKCFNVLFKSKRIYSFSEVNSKSRIIYLEPEEFRKDYFLQSNFFISKIFGKNVGIIKYNAVYDERVDMSLLFQKTLVLVYMFLSVFLRKHNYPLKSFLYYIIKILESQRFYYDLKLCLTKCNKPDVFITFYDMKRYGNLGTQLCNYKNIITITQQHAVYFAVNDNVFIQPAMNYLNLISKYFFVWGQYTIDQYSKVLPVQTKMIISGSNHPRYNKEVNFLEKSIENQSFGVLLSSEYFFLSNQALLNLSISFAKSKNYKLTVYYHPTNQLNEYRKHILEIDEEIIEYREFNDNEIERHEFFCCHTTTLIYSILRKGVLCFRYLDELLINLPGPQYFFTDLSSLERLAFHKPECSKADIIKDLEYVFGNNDFDYSEEINKIINKKD